MRPIVFIVLIFSAPINSVFAQSINGRINYEVKLMEDNLYYPGTLYFNKDTSVFQYKNHIEKRWFRNEGIGKIQSEDTDSIGRLAIRVINSNYPQYIIRDFCGSDVKIYIDTVEMKWVLSNEQKMIGEYLCKKATTRFRGLSKGVSADAYNFIIFKRKLFVYLLHFGNTRSAISEPE